MIIEEAAAGIIWQAIRIKYKARRNEIIMKLLANTEGRESAFNAGRQLDTTARERSEGEAMKIQTRLEGQVVRYTE